MPSLDKLKQIRKLVNELIAEEEAVEVPPEPPKPPTDGDTIIRSNPVIKGFPDVFRHHAFERKESRMTPTEVPAESLALKVNVPDNMVGTQMEMGLTEFAGNVGPAKMYFADAPGVFAADNSDVQQGASGGVLVTFEESGKFFFNIMNVNGETQTRNLKYIRA